MSLKNILLGLLAEPASGYDLKKAFEGSVAHFWHAELSQIYPTLARLEADGLLESRREPSDKGPDRKVYHRTREGEEALRSWLTGGPESRSDRMTWLAQVFFLGQQPDPAVALAFLRRLRAEVTEKLDALRAIEAGWKEETPGYPDELLDGDFYPQLTLDLGLRKLALKLQWCDDCIRRIEERVARSEGRA